MHRWQRLAFIYFAADEDAHVQLESLDELANLAATLFSPIPNRGRDPLPMMGSQPFGDEQKGVSCFIESGELYVYHVVDIGIRPNYNGDPCP